ncbi:MAG: hypothetical protein HGA19_01855 [Oscillochloris sp.]|nr:hypothetical protein [Oscillochloris sp.]
MWLRLIVEPQRRSTLSTDKHTPPQRILFFGDSRADWWVMPQLASAQCMAQGFPGASSNSILQRLSTTVSLRPNMIVVQAGVNDLVELTFGRQNRAQTLARTSQNIAGYAALNAALAPLLS